jgi:hypothetical protein
MALSRYGPLAGLAASRPRICLPLCCCRSVWIRMQIVWRPPASLQSQRCCVATFGCLGSAIILFICSLFNDVVCRSVMNSWPKSGDWMVWILKWKECGSKRHRPNLSYSLGICPEELTKSTKSLSENDRYCSRDSNRASFEFKLESTLA